MTAGMRLAGGERVPFGRPGDPGDLPQGFGTDTGLPRYAQRGQEQGKGSSHARWGQLLGWQGWLPREPKVVNQWLRQTEVDDGGGLGC